jgi:acyl-coenzyme A thioesterase PaaI-like protein
MRISAKVLRHLLNCWPPYLGTGIKVTHISPDFYHAEVIMKLRWYNRNYVGIHFGGSIFAMTDPFYMLLISHLLGKNYIVLDKSSAIDFKRKGTSTLKANFILSPMDIQSIREQADQHGKYVFDRNVDVLNENGQIVASIVKTLYVKRKNVVRSKISS